MACTPKNIILSSPLERTLRYKNGRTKDIVQVIMDMDTVADEYVDAEAAECLRGKTDYATLRNVWAFVKGNVRYSPDPRGKETVKSPAALFKMGVGDCKSFSIAEAALLRALGFRDVRFRFAAYGGSSQVTHVYVTCKSGGRTVILDAVYDHFDKEEPYDWKQDIRAADARISGLPTGKAHIPMTAVLGLGLIAWGLTK